MKLSAPICVSPKRKFVESRIPSKKRPFLAERKGKTSPNLRVIRNIVDIKYIPKGLIFSNVVVDGHNVINSLLEGKYARQLFEIIEPFGMYLTRLVERFPKVVSKVPLTSIDVVWKHYKVDESTSLQEQCRYLENELVLYTGYRNIRFIGVVSVNGDRLEKEKDDVVAMELARVKKSILISNDKFSSNHKFIDLEYFEVADPKIRNLKVIPRSIGDFVISMPINFSHLYNHHIDCTI